MNKKLPRKTTTEKKTFPKRAAQIYRTTSDIIKRKQAEEALHKSEEHYRALINQNLAGIFEIDLNGKIIFANDEFCRMLGYECDEMLEKQISDFVHAEDLSISIQKLKQMQKDKKPFEVEKRFVKKDGSVIWVHNSISPITDGNKNIHSAVIVSLDITERKISEEALRQSEERYRTLFNSIDEGFCTIEVIFDKQDKPFDYRFLTVNPAFTLQTGLENPVGKTVREFVPNHEPFWFETYGRIAKTGESTRFEHEAAALGKFYDVYAFRIGEPNENRVAVIFNDIGVRKKAQQALHESNEQLQLIIESTKDYAIITFDLKGFITGWNSGAERIFGYSEKEVLGRYAAFLFTPEDQSQGIPEQEMRIALKEGRAEDERWHIDKNGSRFFMSGVLHPLKDGRVKGFVKIARDLTEWLKAEKTFHEKEMLKKLVIAQEGERKRIARDLHDELGQQLTALRMKLGELRNNYEDSVFLEQLNEIQNIAKRIDEGVDFLAWELRPAVLDDLGLVAALDTYIKQWSHFSGIKAEFVISNLKRVIFSSEVGTCLYRVVQEALNNIYKHSKATKAEIVLEKRNDFLILIIEDNGKGFNQKNKTNRQKGMDLAGMRERTALVGGTLEIESELKKGTTIYVRIPFTKTKNK